MTYRKSRTKHFEIAESKEETRSSVTTKAERVVSLPGRPGGGVVVTVSLSKTTVLYKALVNV